MTNLDRMIKLAEEFFETKNDPDQLSVTEEVMARLRTIHPATLTEERNEDGPIAWVLVVPTTQGVMEQFIEKKITERDLFDRTLPEGSYDALYLCSALVLPEFRGRGIAKRVLMSAIKAIRADHPIKSLFYWAFSVEGERLAVSVSRQVGLSLYRRTI
jgi:GNAT superfamily N-acetyltransferase